MEVGVLEDLAGEFDGVLYLFGSFKWYPPRLPIDNGAGRGLMIAMIGMEALRGCVDMRLDDRPREDDGECGGVSPTEKDTLPLRLELGRLGPAVWY